MTLTLDHWWQLSWPSFLFSAPYFIDCITENDLDEVNIEIMRNTLYKAYLEDFYNFCKELGGATAEVMCELLAFEADRRAFMITINSFNVDLPKDERAKLYPKCGKLYPDGLAQLAKADEYEQVRMIAENYAVSGEESNREAGHSSPGLIV